MKKNKTILSLFIPIIGLFFATSVQAMTFDQQADGLHFTFTGEEIMNKIITDIWTINPPADFSQASYRVSLSCNGQDFFTNGGGIVYSSVSDTAIATSTDTANYFIPKADLLTICPYSGGITANIVADNVYDHIFPGVARSGGEFWDLGITYTYQQPPQSSYNVLAYPDGSEKTITNTSVVLDFSASNGLYYNYLDQSDACLGSTKIIAHLYGPNGVDILSTTIATTQTDYTNLRGGVVPSTMQFAFDNLPTGHYTSGAVFCADDNNNILSSLGILNPGGGTDGGYTLNLAFTQGTLPTQTSTSSSATGTLDIIMPSVVTTFVQFLTMIFTDFWPFALVIAIVAGFIGAIMKFFKRITK